MANILFTHPMMWFGLAALGIPVAIHLLTRRTPQDMVFPTLQFLRAAMARQSHLFRLRHILLLVLRSLLLLLLLLAFLKPVLTSNARHTSKTDKAQAHQIICLDTSISMGVASGGVTPFTQAKAMAAQILEGHRPGHRINLIRMANSPQRSFEEPGESLFFLRKDLQETQLSQERANVDAALAEAVRQLDEISGGRKQIFLISDFQRSNWSAVNFQSVPEDIELVFMPAGLPDVGNCAITDVRIQPTSPTVGEPINLVCRISNYSDQPCRLPVECQFKEGDHFNQEVTLNPQSSASVNFKLQFKTAGQYEVTLVLPPDDLAIDNRRFVRLDVANKINVLLVSDARGGTDEVATRLLSRAINPYLNEQQATTVASVIPSNQINAVDLARAQVVILSEIHELTPSAARVIVDYLQAGGSVIYFHVGGADSHNLRRLETVSDDAFVCPYLLTAEVNWRNQDQAAIWTQANFDHAILKKFKATGQLADIHFRRYFGTERKGQKGQVLVRYDDGTIAMAQATVGAGVLHLCNFSCALPHSDIAKHTLFVPLIHEMIRGLRPVTHSRYAFVVGRQCSMSVPGITADTPLEFRNPDDEALDGSSDQALNGAVVFFPQTDRAGFYRVWTEGRIAGAIAVNTDPLESNLEILEVTQLEALTQKAHTERVMVAAGPSGLERALSGKPLWHYCLLAALALLCVEQVLVVACRQ